MTFRDFLENSDESAGGFPNYGEYLWRIFDRMVKQNEWIRPNESLANYAERHQFSLRSIDLAGFFSNNDEVENLLHLRLERRLSPAVWEFAHEQLRLEIDGMLYERPALLISQEFARRNFNWWE